MDNKYKFNIEITNKCIIGCSGCPRTWFKKQFPKVKQIQEMDIDVLCNFLEGITEVVHFEGNTGDAIYHSKFLELVKRIKNMQIRVQITTNASGKRESFWQNLVEILSPTDEIEFSIDGLEDTNHLYRINSKWPTVLRALKIVGSSGVRSVWKFIVFKHNEHQIEEAKTMAKSLGIDKFRIITSIKGFDPNYDKNLMPSEKYRSTEEKTRSLIMEGEAPEKMSPQCLKHGKVKDFIFISVFGDFYPCCYIGTYLIAYKTMWNPRNKKYNIKNKKIKDILTDKDVVNFYESTKRLETANNYCKIFCGDLNG